MRATPSRETAGRILLVAVSTLLSLIAVEVICVIMVKGHFLMARSPGYSMKEPAHSFWGDIDENFGVWHVSRSFRHRYPCFDITYESNSYGARDRERSRVSDARDRVVVLGDSFTEGYGVGTADRFTDRLEGATGREHLNFGTSGDFGPTQYYLLYKHLASQFTHAAVIVGIVPANDFLDDDIEYGEKAHAGRYRPYWAGDHPEYSLRYFRPRITESDWHPDNVRRRLEQDRRTWSGRAERFLRGFTYSYNVYRYGSDIRKRRAALARGAQRPETGDTTSFFYGYDQDGWLRMKYSLERLKREAGDRRVLVVTIPVMADLRAYGARGGSLLGSELRAFCESQGMEFLDLLPLMYRHAGDHDGYYHSCDSHWSGEGHRVAAELIEASVEYRALFVDREAGIPRDRGD